MMHSPVYIAICLAALASMLLFGNPGLSSLAFIAALAIAVLGVPHGGLDHWTGRRLLRQRFASHWWAVFFPTYLAVGLLFAWGWFIAPTFTVVLFFVVSAWHFGREDELASHATYYPNSPEHTRQVAVLDAPPRSLNTLQPSFLKRTYTHVLATATGGLVIWLPALARPSELQSLLSLIVPTTAGADGVSSIALITQAIALCLVPLALSSSLLRLIPAPYVWRAWVPLATAAIAVCTPILLSFSIYFCGWHSWQGLQRLRREEGLSIARFIRSVTPLSLAAVGGVALAGIALAGTAATSFGPPSGWFDAIVSSPIRESLLSATNFSVSSNLSANTLSDSLRTLFIGLSAIAVPHLLLHEWVSLRAQASPNQQVSG